MRALRVAMNVFPLGFEQWRGWIAVLAVAGIVIAAGVAMRQRDLKFVIGYSSVSHMGFVLLGLATGTLLGAGGAVLQMFSHGVIAALLFAVAGRMIYARTHTRDLDKLGAMNLRKALPFAAFTFVIASAASMGIPGFSGFAAEVTVLIGTWQAWPVAVLITVAGMVLVAAFTLRALKRTFFADGDTSEIENHQPSGARQTAVGSPEGEAGGPRQSSIGNQSLPPITLPEKAGAILLMLATLIVGLFPSLLLDKILPAIERMNWMVPPAP